jgi:transcriptional regulator of arginine metabolism
VDSLLIVKTDRGQAQGLAEWIDRAQLPEVAGTIGGDDTILLIGRGREAAERLEKTLSAMVKG